MADQPLLLRRRELSLPIIAPGATQKGLLAYLALVERPVTALLARERLTVMTRGEFTYRSNPHQVLKWQVVPTLTLRAEWKGEQLEVRSTSCRLVGLPGEMASLGFSLEAVLGAKEASLGGWAEVGLRSRLMATAIGRHLGCLALEAVLDRIERRVGRGLRGDLGSWLEEAAESSEGRG